MGAGIVALIVGSLIVGSYLQKGKALTNVSSRAMVIFSGVKLKGFGLMKGIKLEASMDVSNPTEDKMTFDLLSFDIYLPVPQYGKKGKPEKDNNGNQIISREFLAKMRYDKNTTPKIQAIEPRTVNNIVTVPINVGVLSLSKTLVKWFTEAVQKQVSGDKKALEDFLPSEVYIEGEAILNGVSIPMKGNYKFGL